MIAIGILIFLITLAIFALWLFKLDKKDKLLKLDFLNMNWRQTPKAIFTEKYRQSEFTREEYEHLISNIYGVRSNY
jgi:uncharacterized membrane protein